MVDKSLSTGWQVSLCSVFSWTQLTHICKFTQNGMGDENLIYPQEEDAIVKLTPGNLDCQGVTDNSCNATINEETDYTVSLTLTNNIGSSNPVTRSFNCELSFHRVICGHKL